MAAKTAGTNKRHGEHGEIEFPLDPEKFFVP